MPIAIHDASMATHLKAESFKNEDELQACLERSPNLLVSETEPQVATVQREVSLPSAGYLDLLVVDKEGLPVAVEVKLARNGQSRREVVAQAFDYVSDLSDMTFDELDELVQGALASALMDLVGETQYPTIRKQCATNLRAGQIRLVIAVDLAGEDLRRMVRYMNEHSDIDVRLVSISKFDNGENGQILVPSILVARSETSKGIGPGPKPKDLDPFFAAVLNVYDASVPEDMKNRGHSHTYRQIRPDAWPCGLHYEFWNYSGEMGVELHLESNVVAPFASELSKLAGQKLLGKFPLLWDTKWSVKRGRLLAKITKDNTPDTLVKAMQALMNLTKPLAEQYLQTKQASPGQQS